jgi:hypothetical protein
MDMPKETAKRKLIVTRFARSIPSTAIAWARGGLPSLAGWSLVLLAVALVGAQDPAAKPTRSSSEDDVQPQKSPVFLRIDKDDRGAPKALQCAIAKYRVASGAHQGAVIELVAAVHIGEKSYYTNLNKRFEGYDALLYELVARPEDRPVRNEKRSGANPVSSLQTGMKDRLKLAFQLDEIDYQAPNFVHADMSPEEFGEDMERRNDGFLSMFARVMGSGFATQGSKKSNDAQAEMMSALFSGDTVKLRRAMANQFESMDSQMAGIADKDGKSTLLTERNAKAFEVLRKELDQGKRKVGVFYGAGHLSDMHKRLLQDFQAVPFEVEWVDAWNLSDDAVEKPRRRKK